MIFHRGFESRSGWGPSGRWIVLVAFLTAAGLIVAGAVRAETRRTAPIDRGEQRAAAGTEAGEREIYVPVERDLVRRALDRIVEAWNRRRLETVLGPGFYDRERLLRFLETSVPRDARLRLIALRDMMVLDQSLGMPHPDGSVPVVTEVLVEARTQITWNPTGLSTFRRVDGLNEYRLTLRYRLQP